MAGAWSSPLGEGLLFQPPWVQGALPRRDPRGQLLVSLSSHADSAFSTTPGSKAPETSLVMCLVPAGSQRSVLLFFSASLVHRGQALAVGFQQSEKRCNGSGLQQTASEDV